MKLANRLIILGCNIFVVLITSLNNSEGIEIIRNGKLRSNEHPFPNLYEYSYVDQVVFIISEEYNIGLGMSYQTITENLKKLRKTGQVKNVQIGVIMAGWKRGSRSISVEFTNKEKLDLDLVIPTNKLTLYVENQIVTAISVEYDFKSEHRENVFDSLVKSVSNFLQFSPKIQTVEDDVGNRTKFATFVKDNIIFSIEDNLDGNWASFAPDLRIYYRN